MPLLLHPNWLLRLPLLLHLLQDILCFKPPFALLQNLWLKLLPFVSNVVGLLLILFSFQSFILFNRFLSCRVKLDCSAVFIVLFLQSVLEGRLVIRTKSPQNTITVIPIKMDFLWMIRLPSRQRH